MSDDASKQWPRDPLGLMGSFRGFMIAAVIVQLFMAALDTLEATGVVEIGDGQPLTIAWALGGVAAAFGWLVVFIACVIIASRLTFRMMKNLHVMDAPGEKMGPGWAVGWYFIPFANLIMPMRGVSQIWRGTFALAGEPEPNASIGLWWGAWILSNILAGVSFRMLLESGGMGEFAPTNPELYNIALWVGVASSVLGAAAAWLMVQVFAPMAATQNNLVRARPRASA